MDPKRNLLIVAAVLGGLLFLYGAGALRWIEIRFERSDLQQDIARLNRENLRLYDETRRLREDPTYAEAVARKELGYVRPGETVIRMKDRREEVHRR